MKAGSNPGRQCAAPGRALPCGELEALEDERFRCESKIAFLNESFEDQLAQIALLEQENERLRLPLARSGINPSGSEEEGEDPMD